MNVRALAKNRIRYLLALLALAVAGGLVATLPGFAQAQRGIQPAGTAWCGVTDDGGSVMFDLTADMRFVDWIEINQPPPNGVSITTREGDYSGTTRAQIADDKFIFRKDRTDTECTTRRSPGGSRCTTAPCRPTRCTTPACRGGSEICETKEVNEMMIRGTFKSPESVSGVYSVIVEDASNTRGRAPVRVQREVGTFIAWPFGTAPCP